MSWLDLGLAIGGILLLIGTVVSFWVWLSVMKDPKPEDLDGMSEKWLSHKDRHRKP